jgi:hypothetical protein
MIPHGSPERSTSVTSAIIARTHGEQPAAASRDGTTLGPTLAAASAQEPGAHRPTVLRSSGTVPGTEECCFPDLPMSDRS